MPPPNLANLLRGGDRRSIGQSNKVARLVLRRPKLFRELMQYLWHDDYVVRMRAADAAEKVSKEKPHLLGRYKTRLLGLLAETGDMEMRWHLAQIVPRFKLTASEPRRAAAALRHYLDDRSSIVRAWALNALAALSQHDETLRSEVKQLLEEALQSGTAAMKARARHLLKNLQN